MNFKHLDIRFSFFCRSSYTNKSGSNPIVLRITYRSQRKDIFTGLSCLPHQWDAVSQRVKGRGRTATQINGNLDYFNLQCKEQFDSLKYSGRQFTLDEIVLKLKGDEQMPTSILQYLQEKVAGLGDRSGVDITKATVQKYARCIKHMQSFLLTKYRKRDLAVASINGLCSWTF